MLMCQEIMAFVLLNKKVFPLGGRDWEVSRDSLELDISFIRRGNEAQGRNSADQVSLRPCQKPGEIWIPNQAFSSFSLVCILPIYKNQLLVAPIFRGKLRIIFTDKNWLKKIPWTANRPINLHGKNEVILWPLTSSKILLSFQWPNRYPQTCVGSRQEGWTGLAK